MKITHIVVQTRTGATDHIFVFTDLPHACYPFNSTGEMFRLDAASGTGLEYVRKNFPDVPVRELNLKEIGS